MLGDTVEVPQFFPSKFVLITEILDTFGRLVFDRLRKKSTIYDGDTPIPLKGTHTQRYILSANRCCREFPR
jgi:hypothetical protein